MVCPYSPYRAAPSFFITLLFGWGQEFLTVGRSRDDVAPPPVVALQ